MLVQDILDRSAELHENRTALIFREGNRTYGELRKQSDRLGAALTSLGIRPGDRVLLKLKNSPAFVVSYFGILKAGAVAVPLHTETDSEHLKLFITHAEAAAMITDRESAEDYCAIRNETRTPVQIITDGPAGPEISAECLALDDLIEHGAAGRTRPRRIDLDLESIVYTSGSTGEPKGVMLTHLNTVSNMKSIAEYFRLTQDDRIMVILPFAYIFGKSLLLTHLLAGGQTVLGGSFMYPNVVLDQMITDRVTGFAGVPSTYSILHSRSKLSEMKFPCLRYMCQAGGSLAPQLQKAIAETIRPAEFYVMYGATEAAPRLTYLEPEMLGKKPGSIGKAIPNVEVFVASPEGDRLPAGEEGEIAARGSNIMAGYWKDPERTAAVLRGGLYFTGDMGREDEEGFLYVTGRSRDFMKVKGFRVSALEIEETILGLPGVQETAVIGIEDSIYGEAIRAYVVVKDGACLTEHSIRAFTASRLAPYKVPSSIVFVETLPKNESGKVMKNALREPENLNRSSPTTAQEATTTHGQA